MDDFKKYTELTKIPYLIMASKQITANHTFKDHVYGVSDLALNYLKKPYFFSSSFDNNIILYDAVKFEKINVLKAHNQGVWTIDHSKTDNLLISGSNDNSVIIWDSNNYKPINTLKEHEEAIYDIQFSNGGNLFASCSKGKICLWDIKNLKQPLFTLNDQRKEYVYSMNFISNDKYIVSGFIDGNLVIINSADMTIIFQTIINREFEKLPENLDSGNSIYTISTYKGENKNDEFLVGFSDGTIKNFSFTDNSMNILRNKVFSNLPVTSINTSFDNNHIIAGTKDHVGIIFNNNFEDKFDYSLTCADFLDNNTIITSSYDSFVKIWKI